MSAARLLGASTLVALSACARTSSAPSDAGPVPIATSEAPARPRTVFEGGVPRSHLVRPCRVMAMQGAPTISLDLAAPKPLALDDVARGWMTLAAGDDVTVTLPKTGRELAFVGPGLVEPCVGPDEAWLSRGTFQGSRGSGEAPGAEQWVVTPFGVVRYGAAIVEVSVDGTAVRASLKGGTATILREGATTWERLDPAKGAPPRVVKGMPLGKAGTAAAADRCAKASADVKSLEDALVAPDAAASPTFGDLAMRANDAHVLGRAACAMAKLRADPSATR